MLKQLDSLVTVHRHFVRWERVKHRAQTIAIIEFPDSHPFRRAVDSICNDLEECRLRADACSILFLQEYGAFRGFINGFFFDSPSKMFQVDENKYWDCPEYRISTDCQRKKIMNLTELAYIHILETSGRSFLEAVCTNLNDCASKRKLDQTTKLFDKDCQRIQRQLKRIKICSKQKMGLLLCLLRVGLPSGVSTMILQFLV